MSDQICDTYVRYITHKICNKLLYIYIMCTIYMHYTHTHAHTESYM